MYLGVENRKWSVKNITGKELEVFEIKFWGKSEKRYVFYLGFLEVCVIIEVVEMDGRVVGLCFVIKFLRVEMLGKEI